MLSRPPPLELCGAKPCIFRLKHLQAPSRTPRLTNGGATNDSFEWLQGGCAVDKAALSSGYKSHPAIRSSRKQSEQSWRQRNGCSAVKQLPKSVGAGNPHAAFCGNRGRATASGDPVGVETGARSDRAPAPDHGASAGRSPQQEHCRRPRNQPAHGRKSSRRRHEEDRLALAFGADPLGARRRPGHRGAISRLTDITAQLVERIRGADPRVAPRLDRRAATSQHLRAPLKNNNQITISMIAR